MKSKYWKCLSCILWHSNHSKKVIAPTIHPPSSASVSSSLCPIQSNLCFLQAPRCCQFSSFSTDCSSCQPRQTDTRKVRHDFKLTGICQGAHRLSANKRRAVCARVCVCVCVCDRTAPEGSFCADSSKRKRKKWKWEMWCKRVLLLCLAQTLTPNILKGVSASICCLRVCMWLNVHKLFFFEWWRAE